MNVFCHNPNLLINIQTYNYTWHFTYIQHLFGLCKYIASTHPLILPHQHCCRLVSIPNSLHTERVVRYLIAARWMKWHIDPPLCVTLSVKLRFLPHFFMGASTEMKLINISNVWIKLSDENMSIQGSYELIF